MAVTVYDCRTDNRNLEITPEIRTRFTHIAPREVHVRHSHDLGHEVFLVLEGRLQFHLDDGVVELSAGQCCLVRADQMHQLVNATDEPAILYLSVSPHIEPTHSFWGEGGEKLPPRYGGATARERAQRGEPSSPLPELAAQQEEATRRLADHVSAAAEATIPLLRSLGDASDPGDRKETVDQIWSRLYPVFKATSELAAIWNELAAEAVPHP